MTMFDVYKLVEKNDQRLEWLQIDNSKETEQEEIEFFLKVLINLGMIEEINGSYFIKNNQ